MRLNIFHAMIAIPTGIAIFFQWALWDQSWLIFLAFNIALIAPALYWADDLANMAGRIERRISPSNDPKAGLLSGFISLVAIWLMAAIFLVTCVIRLGIYAVSNI